MAVKPNAQGIVYAGQKVHGMDMSYRPRGRGGYIPTIDECERAGDFFYKHTGKNWNLHVSKGKDVCRDRQRDKIYNGNRGWKYLLEIHSLPDEPLDVPHHILAYHLRDVAYKIVDANACLPKGLLKFIEVLSWIFIVELWIATIVASVLLTVFTAGIGVGAAIAISVAVALVSAGIQAGLEYAKAWAVGMQKLDISGTLKTNEMSLSLLKNNSEIRKRGNKITNTLIYNPSAMFAGGDSFIQGQAGSESFCYTQAYDAHKGLLGTQEVSFIDELCQNRAQVNLAGGVTFMQNLLGFEFPLAQINIFDIKNEQLRLQNQIKEWNMRINSFLSAIAKQGFFMADGKGSISAADLQQHLINTHIYKRQKDFCTVSMINALKNYNKGLRYQNPAVMNDFKLKMDTKAKFMQAFDAQYDVFAQSLDEYASLESQALDFVDFIKQNFAQITTFKNDDDKNFSIYLGIENFINPKIRHSGDKAFSYYLEQLKTDMYGKVKDPEPSFSIAGSSGGDTDGGLSEWGRHYNIHAYAGSSPKIPPFLLENPCIIWGWIYKDIKSLDLGIKEKVFFDGGYAFNNEKEADGLITIYCSKRNNKPTYTLIYKIIDNGDSGGG